MEKVTVVIPCRNEIDYISDFLVSLSDQDYPRNLMEIILVDGMSDDGTREYLESIASEATLVLDNPQQHVSEALNLAIKRSSGTIIVRMDVHSVFSADYISTLVEYLLATPEVGNVGVPCETLPSDTGLLATSISLVLSTPVGVGGSSFRTESPAMPKSVDTVPFGCWRRGLFELIGYFDTDLVRNQDDEFNQRILKSGLEIHLLPGPRVIYYGRSELLAHIKMFYQYGLFKPLVNRKIGKITTVRQIAPASLVAFLFAACVLFFISPKISLACFITTLLAYLLVCSFNLRRYKGSGLKIYIPFVCCVLLTHLAYGIGYLKGLMFEIPNMKIGLSR